MTNNRPLFHFNKNFVKFRRVSKYCDQEYTLRKHDPTDLEFWAKVHMVFTTKGFFSEVAAKSGLDGVRTQNRVLFRHYNRLRYQAMGSTRT